MVKEVYPLHLLYCLTLDVFWMECSFNIFVVGFRNYLFNSGMVLALALSNFHLKLGLLEIDLEKEMATHSSVLAWRIPVMGEPGRLPSMGSHRVGHG